MNSLISSTRSLSSIHRTRRPPPCTSSSPPAFASRGWRPRRRRGGRSCLPTSVPMAWSMPRNSAGVHAVQIGLLRGPPTLPRSRRRSRRSRAEQKCVARSIHLVDERYGLVVGVGHGPSGRARTRRSLILVVLPVLHQLRRRRCSWWSSASCPYGDRLRRRPSTIITLPVRPATSRRTCPDPGTRCHRRTAFGRRVRRGPLRSRPGRGGPRRGPPRPRRPHARVVGRRRRDRAFGVEADPVGPEPSAEVRRSTGFRRARCRTRALAGEPLGHDQRPVVRHDHHAVGERDPVGDLATEPSGGTRDDTGGRWRDPSPARRSR